MGSGKTSAGLILYRRREGRLEVLIAHMGGPLWAKRKRGWSIPKGEYDEHEDPLACARREFEEETGFAPPAGDPVDLGEIVQKSGKRVRAWAIEGDLDPDLARSNTFQLEWPPRSGRFVETPEVDRVEWFTPDAAGERVIKAQSELFDRLAGLLD